MFFGIRTWSTGDGPPRIVLWDTRRLLLPMAIFCALAAGGDVVASDSKQIIGATAELMETASGLTFPARIDTGAQSCSLHVEKIEIKDEAKSRLRNVGKTARVLLKDADGKQLVPGIFAAVPYCIDLIGGPYIETNEAVCKAFRPKSAIRQK